MKTKICPTCNKDLPVTAEYFKKLKSNPFYPTPAVHDDGTGYAIRCTECRRVENVERQRRWRARNADKLTKFSYAYRKKAREEELLRRQNPTDCIPWPATTTL